MEKPKINSTYNLPQDFFELIEPYMSENADVITEPVELIKIWDAALSCKDQHPELSEKIAEWTMSVGASSPLINDNDIFDAIHSEFGRLEVEGNANTTESKRIWNELSTLLTQLKTELK